MPICCVYMQLSFNESSFISTGEETANSMQIVHPLLWWSTVNRCFYTSDLLKSIENIVWDKYVYFILSTTFIHVISLWGAYFERYAQICISVLSNVALKIKWSEMYGNNCKSEVLYLTFHQNLSKDSKDAQRPNSPFSPLSNMALNMTQTKPKWKWFNKI
jgi:hypothetical protein